MPSDRSVPISIGGKVFTVFDRRSALIPAPVRRVKEIAERIPDGQLWTTRDVLAKAGYAHRQDGLITHPLLAPYFYRHSYHTVLWGNKKEIAHVKKTTRQ